MKTSDKNIFDAAQVKRITLDARKPITVEGKVSIFPAVFFGTACFFAALLAILGTANYKDDPDTVLIFIVLVGVLFAAALALFVAYLVRGARLKRQVLSMNVTNGMISALSVDEYWSWSNGERENKYVTVSLDYIFYDENMQLREGSFAHKYKGGAPYFYKGQLLTIAYSDEISYILRKYTVASEEGVELKEIENRESGGRKRTAAKRKSVKDPEDFLPLAAQRKYYIYSAVIFGMVAFVLGALLFFGYLTAKQTGRPLGKVLFDYLPFIAFVGVALGGLAAFYLAVPLRAKAKYKSIIKAGAKFAAGVLVCEDKTYKSDNKNAFYCEFVTADGETRRIKQARMNVAEMIKCGKTAVTVAYNDKTAIVLVKKAARRRSQVL